MAKCGIKTYDALPGRVGLIDVDATRYALGETLKRVEFLKQKLDKAVYLEKEKKKNAKRM
jgi:flagellar biogenesis protein FliO